MNNQLKRSDNVVYMPNRGNVRRNSRVTPSSNSEPNSTPFVNLIVFLAGLSLLIVGGTQYIYARNQEQLALEQLEQAKQQEQQAIAELVATKEEYLLMQDPEYLQEVARRDYYYSNPGEIIFEIEE